MVQERGSLKRKLFDGADQIPGTSNERRTEARYLESATSAENIDIAQLPSTSADTTQFPSTSGGTSQSRGTTTDTFPLTGTSAETFMLPGTSADTVPLPSTSSIDSSPIDKSREIKVCRDFFYYVYFRVFNDLCVLQSKGLLRYRCILCGCTRDVCYGRMSSSSRQLTGVLLATLLAFKRLDIERARMTYGLCFAKRKMLCRRHYTEAVCTYSCFQKCIREWLIKAACIAGEAALGISGLTKENYSEMMKSRSFEVPQRLLDRLNTWAKKLDVSKF